LIGIKLEECSWNPWGGWTATSSSCPFSMVEVMGTSTCCSCPCGHCDAQSVFFQLNPWANKVLNQRTGSPSSLNSLTFDEWVQKFQNRSYPVDK
jgi:hypothetical protein